MLAMDSLHFMYTNTQRHGSAGEYSRLNFVTLFKLHACLPIIESCLTHSNTNNYYCEGIGRNDSKENVPSSFPKNPHQVI